MLIGISCIMMVMYTIYFNQMAQAKKQEFQSGLGKCMAMALGMLSGTAIGLMIAVQIPQLLAVSTISAIISSSILVFFIGKPFGLAGIIESLSSSMMGAMMGAMLGAMLQSPWTNVMIVALDAIYMISVFSLGLLFNKNPRKISISFLVSFILPLCIIGMAAFLQATGQGGEKNMMMNDMPHHQE